MYIHIYQLNHVIILLESAVISYFPMYIPIGIRNLYAYSNSDLTWVTEGSDKTQEKAAK